MKKTCIVFALILILLLAAVAAANAGGAAGAPAGQTVTGPAEQARYLRLHVRANSDAAADQAVKYAVKDAVTEYLLPLAASCRSKREPVSALEGALAGIEGAADAVLAAGGFAYTARASLRRESFPARVYEGLTLGAGVYDALIVELGAGSGANWWCVVYPPLCFSGAEGGEGVRYRSRLWEIVQNFFAD